MELPRLTVLNEQYAIRSVLGEIGPFEALYLAWDLENEEQVVIREYLPLLLAERELPGVSLRMKAPGHQQIFDYGYNRLKKELAILSAINHPNIARVRSYFPENNTIYSVFDYHPGASLQHVLLQNDGKVSARTAITIMMPFLDGIKAGHKGGLLHGSISPQNIYLSKTGRPMVLSFKTTQLLLATQTETLEHFQQPGYSPPEQYVERGKHGPWSDVYSCAATLYTMLTGNVLPNIPDRFREDTVPALLERDRDLLHPLQAPLESALSLNIKKRPANIEAFSQVLTESVSMGQTVPMQAADPEPPPRPQSIPADFQSSGTFASQPVDEDYSPSAEPPTHGVYEDEQEHDLASHDAPFGGYSQDVQNGVNYDRETGNGLYDQIYSNGNAHASPFPEHSPQEQPLTEQTQQDPSFADSYANGLNQSGLNQSGLHQSGLHQSGLHQSGLTDRPASSPPSTILSDTIGISSRVDEAGLIPSPPYQSLPAQSDTQQVSTTYPPPAPYEQAEPDATFAYASRTKKRPSFLRSYLPIVVVIGFAFALVLVIYSRMQGSNMELYNTFDERRYNQLIVRGDSLLELAHDVPSQDRAVDLYRNALETYYAANSMYRDNPLVRLRIKELEKILLNPTEEMALDRKRSNLLISTGDSLMYAGDLLFAQGDSVNAGKLYQRARANYSEVYQAFPEDSLAAARLREASVRMTRPAPVVRREEEQPRPAPQLTEEAIQQQMFVLFKSQGDTAYTRGNFDEANRKYKEALEHDPANAEIQTLIARTERQIMESARLQEYRRNLRDGRTLKEEGKLTEALRSFELAQSALNNTDVQQAIFEVQSLLDEQDRNRQNYVSYRTRGDLLLEQKQYENALKSYEAALASKPDDEYVTNKIEETKRDIEALNQVTDELPEGMVTNGIYNFTEEPPQLIGGIEVLQNRIIYPPKALDARIEGRVTVRMIVDETGQMSNPSIIKSLGFGCDEEVLRVIRGARFEPGRVGGTPVSSWHTLYFEFTL